MKRIVCIFLCIFTICSFFSLHSAANTEFDDIKESDWFYAASSEAAKRGIMTGVGDNKFAPAKLLTREEAAVIIYRVSGSTKTYSSYSFKDVKPGSWYADGVEWLYQTGYAKGVNKNNFGVGQYITRQDLMLIIYRMCMSHKSDSFMIYYSEDNFYNFSDHKNTSAYAVEAMKFATGLTKFTDASFKLECFLTPLLKGGSGNRLNPKGNCTRAEMAQMVYNLHHCGYNWITDSSFN